MYPSGSDACLFWTHFRLPRQWPCHDARVPHSVSARRSLLRHVPGLATSADQDLDRVLALTDERPLPAGAELIRQGDAAAEAYLVVMGELDITTNGVHRDSIGPGTLVGEMALLSEGARMSTVTARTECRLLVLGEEAFAELLGLPGVPAALAAEMVKRLRNYAASAPAPSRGAWDSLTRAERQVASLIAEGLSNREVAERLVISRHTVESHLKHIFAKLRISSRLALAVEAAARGAD